MLRRPRTLFLLGALLLAGAALLLLWPSRSPDTASSSPLAAGPAPSASPSPSPTRRPPPPPRAAPEAIRLSAASVAPDAGAALGAFEGRVLSTDGGGGVAGAELTFALHGAAWTVRAGQDGAFTFVPGKTGTYQLAAVTARGYFPYAPEWGHSPITLTTTPGRRIHGIAVFLTPAADYAGVVHSPTGAPVPGAEVRILQEASGELALLPLQDRFLSDAAGEFRFSSRDGALLEARHPDYSPGRARLALTSNAAGPLVIRLTPRQAQEAKALAISGQVFDPQGIPAEGALVVASLQTRRTPDSGDTLRTGAQATADADGRFWLEGLDAGRYQLSARREGLAPARAFGIAAGTRDVMLRLQAGGKIRGTVRDARIRAPVVSFTVGVSRRAGLARRELFTQAVVDAEGRYELAGVPPGALAIQVAAYGYAPSEEVALTLDVEAATPGVADFDLQRGGRLSGIVVDEETRAPIAEASISVEGLMGSAASAIPVVSDIRSGQDGRFELSGLAAGLQSVSVSAAGHHSRILSGLRAEEGGDIGPLTIELAPTRPGEEPRLELAGIGAVLQPRGEVLIVSSVLPGGGAAEVHLGPGDAVLSVDGQPVKELGFQGAIQRIRGPEGSTVLLTVRKAGSPHAVELAVPRRRVRTWNSP